MLKVKLGIIAVENYDRAKEFYTQKLDFKVITDAKFGDDGRWIELKSPETETGIALFNPPGQPFQANPCSNIIFGCSNVETKYKELLQKGVEFVQPPKQESWGTSALFKDSEGNTFCLSSE